MIGLFGSAVKKFLDGATATRDEVDRRWEEHKMGTKKTIAFIVAVMVIAMGAFTIIVAWLSANLPSANDEVSQPVDYEEADLPVSDEIYEHIDYPPDARYPDSLGGNNGYLNEEYPIEEYANDEIHLSEEYPETIFTPIFTSEPLPEHIIEQITGITFHEDTPFDHSFLAYLTVTHANFEGESTIGHLIVAAEISDEVLDIFREIYEYRFPIYSIKLIDYFDASDYLSMAANNSHAFNFRYIAGTTIISRHGFGMAIDINPIQNPYIRGDTIWPAAGAVYLDRNYVRPGMIIRGDVVYRAFTSRGWTWGGNWNVPRDYHHFERR